MYQSSSMALREVTKDGLCYIFGCLSGGKVVIRRKALAQKVRLNFLLRFLSLVQADFSVVCTSPVSCASEPS